MPARSERGGESAGSDASSGGSSGDSSSSSDDSSSSSSSGSGSRVGDGAVSLPAGEACRVAGCLWRCNQPDGPSQQASRHVAQLWKKHAIEAQHDLAGFRACHLQFNWAKSLRYCAECDVLFSGFAGTQHRDSAMHREAVAAAGMAAAAAATPAPQPQAGGQPRANRATATAGPAAPARDEAAAYSWSLKPGDPVRTCLDALSVDAVEQLRIKTICDIPREWRDEIGKAYCFTLESFQQSVAAAEAPRAAMAAEAATEAIAEAEAWAKLQYLFAAIVLSPHPQFSRSQRVTAWSTGGAALAMMLHATLGAINKAAAKPRRQRTAESVARYQANLSRLACERRGLGRACRRIERGACPPVVNTPAVLEVLRAKHPQGDLAEQLREAEEAGWDRVRDACRGHGGGEAVPAGVPAPPTSFSLSPAAVRTGIMKSDANSAPGPSGLSNSHLQCMLQQGQTVPARLTKALAWLGTAVFKPGDGLPPTFWRLFTSANLTAVGEKLRPIACGDTLRRLFTSIYCKQHRARFADLFESVAQYGVAVSDGVERIVTMAQLVVEGGGGLLAIDGKNAFNAVSRTAVLAQVAEFAPDLYPLVAHMYGVDSKPSLLVGIDGRAAAAIIQSLQGVQQGDPLGPLLFALALIPILRDFQQAFPQLALPAYLDDLTLLCLTGEWDSVSNLAIMAEALEWLQARLMAIGVEINRTKTVCLLPAAAAVDGELQRAAVSTQLGGVTVAAEAGTKLLGVPVGTSAYVRAQMPCMLRTVETDRLLQQAGELRNDTQLGFQLLQKCVLPRAQHLARAVAPSDAVDELRVFDAAVLCAATAVMQEPESTAGSHVAEAAIPERDDVAGLSDVQVCLERVRAADWDGHVPVDLTLRQQQQMQLTVSQGGMGFVSMERRCRAAFVGRMAAVLVPALSKLPTVTQHLW